jgi:hypothetical protein
MIRPNLDRLALLSIAIFVLVLFCSSYHRYRLFSHEGRLLVLALKDDTFTTQWLRDRPPTPHEWRPRLPKNAWQFAGVTHTIDSYGFTFMNGGRDISMSIPIRYWEIAIPYPDRCPECGIAASPGRKLGLAPSPPAIAP